jgi:hypothetical protein
MQGMNVTLKGELFANGGGGGAGNQTVTQAGSPGEDGKRSPTEAAAGGALGTGNGGGGAGGVGVIPPRDGQKRVSADASAGAGGGSVGFIQTYTPNGVTPELRPVAVSPPLEPNLTIPTK